MEKEEIEVEESDLEEDMEEQEQEVEEETFEIEEDKFVEFLSSSNQGTSPILGQVAVASELRATDLEQDLSNVIGLETKKEDDPFKYQIGGNSEESPKYFTSENEIERTASPSGMDITSLGKDSKIISQVGFSASPSTKIGETEGAERYELPDKFDIDNAGKGELFERPDVKYKPSM